MMAEQVLIRDLDDDERSLLRQFAADLRRKPVRTIVSREAFERVARHLESAAER